MEQELKPALGLQPGFPLAVWTAVAEAVRPSFADSYLARAICEDRVVIPKTRIAYDRLRMEPAAIRAIERCGYHLLEPADELAKWRPLTDAEYAALSMRDKIRHRQVLASEARAKAGPQWRAGPGKSMDNPGWPVKAEDMPPTWHHWRQVAANHDAEIKALRKIIEDGHP